VRSVEYDRLEHLANEKHACDQENKSSGREEPSGERESHSGRDKLMECKHEDEDPGQRKHECKGLRAGRRREIHLRALFDEAVRSKVGAGTRD